MSIRVKGLFFIIGFVLLLTGMLYWVAQTFMLGSFIELEEETTSRTMESARNRLDDLVGELAIAVGDWAPWDDTYWYVLGKNPAYEEANLTEGSFSNLKLNTMVFIDASGAV
jgi:sensor domain CHASE-containing protein